MALQLHLPHLPRRTAGGGRVSQPTRIEWCDLEHIVPSYESARAAPPVVFLQSNPTSTLTLHPGIRFAHATVCWIVFTVFLPMLTVGLYYTQILWAVVLLVTIQMMDYLPFPEEAPKFLRGAQSVFVDIACHVRKRMPVSFNQHIAMLCNGSSAFPSRASISEMNYSHVSSVTRCSPLTQQELRYVTAN